MFLKKPQILTFLLIALIIVNAGLIIQNRRLSSIIDELHPTEIETGDAIKGFEANTLDGRIVNINFGKSGVQSVLLYFQPSCGFCKKQMPNWKTLIDNAEPSRFRIKLITADSNVDSVRNYLSEYGINEQDALIVSSDFVKDVNLNGTPTTVVLDSEGKVEHRWIGLWKQKDMAEAEAVFKLKFSLADVTSAN
ncbi:MAG: TlpA family protein disulfide reductase [Pyrinomonadaceae bacterium]